MYVTTGGAAGSLRIFARNRRTGEIAQLRGAAGCITADGSGGCTEAPTLEGPGVLALSPDGRNAYASTARGVVAFARGRRGGLRQLAGQAGCFNRDGADGCTPARGIGGAEPLAVSPDGRTVYVASIPANSPDVDIAIFRRDASRGGALSQPAGPGGCVDPGGQDTCGQAGARSDLHLFATDLTVSPDGRSLYLLWANIFEGEERETGALSTLARDRTTGALSQAATGGGTGDVSGDATALALSRDGRSAYVVHDLRGHGEAFRRNRATGGLRTLPGRYGCFSEIREPCTSARGIEFPADIAVSPDGRNVYFAGSNGVASYTRKR